MPLTEAQLANAELDLATLANVINGAVDRVNPGNPNGTVTSRLGQVLKTLAKTLADASVGSGAGGVHVPVAVGAGQYVNQQVNGIAPVVGAMAADRIDYVLFCPRQNLTIDRIGVEVTTVHAGNNCRVGIHADNGGSVGALLAGGVNSLSVAGLGLQQETVNFTFQGGSSYWLAIQSSGLTAQFRCNPTAGALLFGTPAGGATAGFVSWRGAPAYASGLPSNPSGLTRTAGSIVPLIYMRAA